MAGVIVLALAAGCGGQAAGSPASTISQELAERAKANGFTADHVYVLGADGYALIAGGSGRYRSSDYQAIYKSDDGTLKVTVERRGLTAAQCPKVPLIDRTSDATCVKSGEGFYRTSGEQHEVALVRGPLLVRITGTLERAEMEKAAATVRPATAQELDALLPALASAGRRSDLPKNGDGASITDVGVGVGG